MQNSLFNIIYLLSTLWSSKYWFWAHCIIFLKNTPFSSTHFPLFHINICITLIYMILNTGWRVIGLVECYWRETIPIWLYVSWGICNCGQFMELDRSFYFNLFFGFSNLKYFLQHKCWQQYPLLVLFYIFHMVFQLMKQ